MTFSFYHAESNPTGLSGTVGGAVDLNLPMSGYLGELFCHVQAPPSGTEATFYQYRKLFVRNEGSTTARDISVWIPAQEHTDQLDLANEYETGQTSTSPVTAPDDVSGWNNPTNYLAGLPIGDLAPDSSTGFWLRQTLTEITISDPYVSFQLYAGGLFD